MSNDIDKELPNIPFVKVKVKMTKTTLIHTAEIQPTKCDEFGNQNKTNEENFEEIFLRDKFAMLETFTPLD